MSDHTVDTLVEQAAELVHRLPGPVRRVSLRHGEVALEIEWPERAAAPEAPAVAVPAPPATEPQSADGDLEVLVRAPLVGTFYAAPQPGAAPFVTVGDIVEAGQNLAIIEAMKLMNHIVADVAGEVVEILVEDGAPVEYEQPLIRLQPKDG